MVDSALAVIAEAEFFYTEIADCDNITYDTNKKHWACSERSKPSV